MHSLTRLGALRRAPLALLLGVALTASVGRAQDVRRDTTAQATAPPGAGAERHTLRLADVVARAVAQHPLLDAARARVAAARGARRTAGTLPNPILTYWTEGGQFPGQPSGTQFQRETQTYGTLPLDPLLSRGPRVRRADEDVRAADADLTRARQTVALDAARAFYRVAAAQVAVDAVDDVRARLAELVTYTQARVREGRAAEADLIRTQVEVERLAADATLQRVELARARALLAPYLGPDLGADARRGAPDALRVAVDDAAAAGTGAALPPLPTLLATAQASRPETYPAVGYLARAVGVPRTFTLAGVVALAATGLGVWAGAGRRGASDAA